MTLRSAILALLLCAAHAQARTLYVSTTGSHDTNAPAFSTWATAATNIQAAIDAASDGDTVRVAPGTYTEAVMIDKNNLTVQGGNGTLWDADRTFIDMQGAANSKGVSFSGATNSTLRGFTVVGARPPEGNGAVVIYPTATGCVIESCVVRGNQSAANYTSGIRSLGSSSEARNCIVVGNHAVYGGVSATSYFGPDGFFTIQNCIVEANANYQAYLQIGGRITARNCILGNAYYTTHAGGNVTNNTTNSVCRLLDIARASEGVGTSLVWRGVSAYIPRMGSLARNNGVIYAGIATASDGAGGPALVAIRQFIGRDVSTNRNHGLPVGGVTSAADSPFAGERSAAFDGASGCVSLGTNYNATVLLAPAITIEAWVNPSKTNTIQADIFNGNANSSGFYAYAIDLQPNNVLRVGGRSKYEDTFRSVSSPSPVAQSQWTHVAGVLNYSAGTIQAYVNGTLVTNSAASWGTTNLNVSSTSVGTAIGSGLKFDGGGALELYFPGSISDVRIWNVARTPEQIAAAYTNRLTGTEEGLVGYWPLKDSLINPTDTGPFNLDNPIIHPSYHEAF